jgi:hypothetical protein
MSLNEPPQIEVGRFKPLETALYNAIHDVIQEIGGGKMTPAEVNGLLLQIQLEMLGVFEYE